MQINIGNKKLYEMKQEDFFKFLLFDGVFETKHSIGGEIIEAWKEPVITEFKTLDLDNIHIVEWVVRWAKNMVGCAMLAVFFIIFYAIKFLVIKLLNLKIIKMERKKQKSISFNDLQSDEQKETIINTFKFILNTGRDHYDLNNQKEYEIVLHSFVSNNPLTKLSIQIVSDGKGGVCNAEKRIVNKSKEKDFLKFINFHC